jgi:hypothetical protein
MRWKDKTSLELTWHFKQSVTQQVVGKIEATQHIKTSPRDAGGRECVVVHSTIMPGSRANLK